MVQEKIIIFWEKTGGGTPPSIVARWIEELDGLGYSIMEREKIETDTFTKYILTKTLDSTT